MQTTGVRSVLAAYSILGLEPDATFTDARQAYRALARKLHPDVNGGDARASARYAEVRGAYETLARRVGRTRQAEGVAHYMVAGMLPSRRSLDLVA
jgi:preprotein translocase subunit Sec63